MNTIPYVHIAETFGTPVYVYDAQKITEQFQRLHNAFSSVPSLNLYYAVKANSNLNILKLLHQQGAGLDTVSIEEVKLGLHAGVPSEKIIFTPNGVSIDELIEAKDLGVQINIDNLSVLELFGVKTFRNTCLCENKSSCHGWR